MMKMTPEEMREFLQDLNDRGLGSVGKIEDVKHLGSSEMLRLDWTERATGEWVRVRAFVVDSAVINDDPKKRYYLLLLDENDGRFGPGAPDIATALEDVMVWRAVTAEDPNSGS